MSLGKGNYMDIKKEATKIIKKIQDDPELLSSFTKDPVKTLEKTFNIDLPDDQINALISTIKAKITADQAKSVIDSVGKMFTSKK